MAERWGVVVDRCEVFQAVVVAGFYVVNRVGSFLSADVADASVSAENYEAAGVPVFGESGFAGASPVGGSLVSFTPSLPYRVP